MKPLFHIIKWFLEEEEEKEDFSSIMRISFLYLIGDVINDNNTMCTSVVTTCDRTESFLTGCIPLRTKTKSFFWRRKKNYWLFVIWLFYHQDQLFEFSKMSFKQQFLSIKKTTYEINTDCTNITFGIGAILKIKENWF